ncbi:hypothetical protein LEN26_017412 [Aphanomyces euteiches]|nr:hypothetical protein LEN26_017412 [Aphanomyces euteiches]
MGVGDGFMQNAPALPKAPWFKGSTKTERWRFMEEYNLYIKQTNPLTANGTRPFFMPVETCIYPETKHRLALWDFVKSPDDVMDAEWISWFKLAHADDLRALDVLKKRLKEAVDGMYAAVRCERQDWILHDEGPVVVKITMDAIKPPSFQRAVVWQIILTRKKLLKKDAFRFARCLREYAVSHERCVGDDDQIYKPAQLKKHMNIRGAVASKVAVAPAIPVAAPVDHNAPERACHKCRSPDHSVRDCPDATPEQAAF